MSTTVYKKEFVSFNEENTFEVEGKVIHVSDSSKGLTHGAEVLLELPENDDNDDPVIEPIGGGEKYYCEYPKDSGGLCSREVDHPGDRCWQHPKEENDE
ncbi:hypothetical protein [Halocatena marina]|uniref:hypothetical protein n=1 Tax=Halocatena marina TaxID=2934937 RepID=UPI00222F50FD|nr:hypothetical protein [Halocatena marina]